MERRWGYLAGADAERAADLAGAPAPALLACVRGGWGAARLLERPLALGEGWLLGFSDVTSLLWARVARGQGGAVHGPLLTTLAAVPGILLFWLMMRSGLIDAFIGTAGRKSGP